jgi:RNA polymerase sigma factor (sigma-70 family)
MQECYLQLVKCLEKFDSSLEVPFESYYKIQLYGWRSNQNRKKREFLSQQQESNDEITQQIDEEADTQKQVERKCFYEAVMKELRHMQPTEQTLVIGYYLQNKSLKELAKVMGINYKTAEFRKGKALRQLKILLSSYQ